MTKFKRFIRDYWQYYKELEDELLATRKCVDFYKENFSTFSVEYLKLYQAVCGEIDVLGKAMAGEVNPSFKADDNGNNIQKWWYEIQDKYLYYENIAEKNDPKSLKVAEVKFLDDEVIKPWSGYIVETHRAKNGALT